MPASNEPTAAAIATSSSGANTTANVTTNGSENRSNAVRAQTDTAKRRLGSLDPATSAGPKPVHPYETTTAPNVPTPCATAMDCQAPEPATLIATGIVTSGINALARLLSSKAVTLTNRRVPRFTIPLFHVVLCARCSSVDGKALAVPPVPVPASWESLALNAYSP